MRTIQRFLAVFLCASVWSASLAAEKQTSYGVKYSGGSMPTIKSGEDLKMFLDPDQVRLLKKHQKDEPLLIGAKSITEISYGQEVHRRIGTAVGLAIISLGIGALTAFSKSKKHYIGIVWDSGDGKKGGLVIQADKNEYRGIIAGLEGLTGKTAVNTDVGRPNS
jgi:hypothetical protein